MSKYMINGIVLNVKLQGQLSSPVSNKSSKEITSKVKKSPFEKGIVDGRKVNYVTPNGLYLALNNFQQREIQGCVRKMNISGEVIKMWLRECPQWEKPFIWKSMTNTQKLRSHLNRFDEGFGYSFEEL